MKKLLFLMILTILFSCDTAEDYHNQALSNCKLGNYNEAINDFNKAIDLNPNNANTFYLRGHTATLLRNYNEAIDDFNKAIELNPSEVIFYIGIGNANFL